MSKVAVVKKEKDEDLSSHIKRSLKPLGGIEGYIKPGEKVLLKPNFNTADPPPASSDPLFIKEVAQLVLGAGAGSVLIGDSSTFYQNTRKNFAKVGLFELEKMDDRVKVISFDEGRWRKKKIDGKYLSGISTPEILEKVDKVLYLACLKTHFIAKYTGALKLGVAFMKPIERLPLHAGYTEEKIAEMNLAFKPDLIIMDGRKAFIDGGPAKGKTVEPEAILASESRVEIDTEAVKIIKSYPDNSLQDLEPEEIKQISLARKIGIT